MLLLSDKEIRQFIRDGFILVRADFAEPIHRQIYEQLEEVFADEGNPGNNLLPRIPQIKQVFDHPAVAGALTSLLGPGYIMNPHRHCHLNPPGGKGQSWHKDCYVFDHNTRHPRFHWILALYYPQDTTADMGPTAILPRAQDLERISDADAARSTEAELPLCGEAGTVALIHFDSWHRASANLGDRKRYMLKFQFARMAWPPAPAWDHQSDEWVETGRQEPVWRHVWKWLGGGGNGTNPGGGIDEFLALLERGDEAERLRAACLLGEHGAAAAPPLLESLRREANEVEPRVEEKTADNAHGTNPTGMRAAQALAAGGPELAPLLAAAAEDQHWLVRAALCDVLAQWGPAAAVALPALRRCLGDEHWWVRRNAAEAIGRMGTAGDEALPDLVARLRDDDRRVRRATALGLAQRGPGAAAIGPLQQMFADGDRYNRFYARLALSRIDEPRARDLLLDDLMTARWCPLTSTDNMY